MTFGLSSLSTEKFSLAGRLAPASRLMNTRGKGVPDFAVGQAVIGVSLPGCYGIDKPLFLRKAGLNCGENIIAYIARLAPIGVSPCCGKHFIVPQIPWSGTLPWEIPEKGLSRSQSDAQPISGYDQAVRNRRIRARAR